MAKIEFDMGGQYIRIEAKRSEWLGLLCEARDLCPVCQRIEVTIQDDEPAKQEATRGGQEEIDGTLPTTQATLTPPPAKR